MRKRTITIWWIWGLGIVVVGAILIVASSLALVAHIQSVTVGNTYTFNPNDSIFWTLVGLIVLGCLATVGGFAAQFVAWIGAVTNTHRLADKTWFTLLLAGGIAGIVTSPVGGLGGLLCWGLMVAYLISGPEGMAVQPVPIERPAEPTMPPKTLVPMG